MMGMDLHIEAGTGIVGGHGLYNERKGKERKEMSSLSFRCSVALALESPLDSTASVRSRIITI